VSVGAELRLSELGDGGRAAAAAVAGLSNVQQMSRRVSFHRSANLLADLEASRGRMGQSYYAAAAGGE
jgi:hypothetical protein